MPDARVAAKLVLKALTTREEGRAAAISAAFEESAGTTRESKVSKFTGLVMSTTTLPASCSPRSAMIPATAGCGTARTTTSPVTAVAASAVPSSCGVPPFLTTRPAMAWPMFPVPMIVTVLMSAPEG